MEKPYLLFSSAWSEYEGYYDFGFECYRGSFATVEEAKEKFATFEDQTMIADIVFINEDGTLEHVERWYCHNRNRKGANERDRFYYTWKSIEKGACVHSISVPASA